MEEWADWGVDKKKKQTGTAKASKGEEDWSWWEEAPAKKKKNTKAVPEAWNDDWGEQPRPPKQKREAAAELWPEEGTSSAKASTAKTKRPKEADL